MIATLAEQLARRVRVAAGPHDNPDMSVQQVVSAMAQRIAELEQDKARLDSGCIMTNERDEFGHEYQCERRGLNLRERIDAALARQGKEGET